MLIRRSFDQGDTWENDGILINDYPGEAANIDQLILQDKNSGRLYSLVLAFPEGFGYPNAEEGTGFKEIDGNQFMVLYDQDGMEYTIREEGIVYDDKNEKTDFIVDQRRNIYKNGNKKSNIFLENSPLQPVKTSYLELWYSDDEGENWDGPINMNPMVKEDWMAFLGVGPGTGIQLTVGDNAGRLVFPIYFTNEKRKQASAVIYSDDHGQTWKRGESPNHGRVVKGFFGNKILTEKTFNRKREEITETQVVEMPDEQLKLFMRNYSGHPQIATSLDGGDTGDTKDITEEELKATYSQMAAFRYNGKIDGEDAVIFASAGHSKKRKNGEVRIGLIKENGMHENGRTNYKFDWKYSQLVKLGSYGYSSLTNLDNGMIGLLYENDTNMEFNKFNVDYIQCEECEKLLEKSMFIYVLLSLIFGVIGIVFLFFFIKKVARKHKIK